MEMRKTNRSAKLMPIVHVMRFCVLVLSLSIGETNLYGNIVYTDVFPDITLGPSELYWIDLADTSDPTDFSVGLVYHEEWSVRMEDFQYDGTSPGFSVFYGHAVGANSNGVTRLGVGDSIGPSSTFLVAVVAQILWIDYGGAPWNGYDTPAYAGFRVLNDTHDAYYYGWIRLSIDTTTGVPTVYNYAYENVLGQAIEIEAGTIPEPAYSGGHGTETEPYQINNITNWQELMTTSDDWNKHFILTADVNLAGVTLTPVGNEITPFIGVFDGNDNVINNAVINHPGSNGIGLFGYVGLGGQIRNLGVENINITGSSFVGGLVGDNFGTLTDCYATGTVSGIESVGGLVGENGDWSSGGGPLTACYARGSVYGSFPVGGLVGRNVSGTLTDCNATGLVTGTDAVGGLVGENGSGTLTSCYAAGSVTGNNLVGGLVGVNFGSDLLTDCYAISSVNGTGDCVGGLVGFNGGSTLIGCNAIGSVTGTGEFVGGLVGLNDGTVLNCYVTGTVMGDRDVGGLIGSNMSIVSNCYATAAVMGGRPVGGLIGSNPNGTVTTSFWDIDTSGQVISAGGIGKTTAQMQTQSTFTDAGWDFVGETINGPNDIWRLCADGVEYPKLYWDWKFPKGDFVCPEGVDFIDFAVLSLAWRSDDTPTANWNPHCDISEPSDGIIDMLDLYVFVDNWLGDFKFYDFTLNSDPLWITEGEWAFGEPTGDGGTVYGNPDPASGYTGTNVYGVYLNGDYDSTTPSGPHYLTGGPFDCSLYHNVRLKFARWLNTDYPPYVSNKIEASNNGTDWQVVWKQRDGQTITDNYWRITEYDISSVACNQSTVYIRWSYEISNEAYPYSGWNIDDIELLGK